MTSESPQQRSNLVAKIILTAAFGVAALGTGLIVFWVLIATRVEPPRKQVADLAPLVESVRLEVEQAVERFTGYGSAEADRTARVAAEVAARVMRRVDSADAGVFVEAGTPIVELDSREYEFALTRAEALADADAAALAEIEVEEEKLTDLMRTSERELAVAASEKQRVVDLFERELAAEREFNVARLAFEASRRTVQQYERELAKIPSRRARAAASLAANRAAAELARLHVERCTIRAPFSGTLEDVFVEQGDLVAPGTVVAQLVDLREVEIAVQLRAGAYGKVAIGAEVLLESESTPGLSWEGAALRLSPTVDQATRTFSAFVRVDNREQRSPLVPGTFVKATVTGPSYKGLIIPRGAIRDGLVLVHTDGHLQRRGVTVETYLADRALVRGDVAPGDVVILSLLEQLEPGDAVRLRTSSISSSGGESAGGRGP